MQTDATPACTSLVHGFLKMINTLETLIKYLLLEKLQEASLSAISRSFFFFFLILFIYLFIYFWLRWVFVAAHGLSPVAARGGYSSLRCVGFSLWWFLLLRSMGSRCTGFSSCGTQAQQLWLAVSRVQAQQLWCTGLVVPRHVGSSQTRDRTRVPRIGRQILNHCATREVPRSYFCCEVFIQPIHNPEQLNMFRTWTPFSLSGYQTHPQVHIVISHSKQEGEGSSPGDSGSAQKDQQRARHFHGPSLLVHISISEKKEKYAATE